MTANMTNKTVIGKIHRTALRNKYLNGVSNAELLLYITVLYETDFTQVTNCKCNDACF
jgi:hypothetical protein